MSGDAQALTKQIASAADLAGVVKSMKSLAASSIGQYERASVSLAHYARTVDLGLSVCLRACRSRIDIVESDHARQGGPIGVVIFGSDQGLVGRFNETAVEFAVASLKLSSDAASKIWVVGERSLTLLADIGLQSVTGLGAAASANGITRLVGELLVDVEAAFAAQAVSAVWIVHNQPNGTGSYEPVKKRLLPLDRSWQDSLAKLPWPARPLPEVIDEAAVVLQALIHEFLFVTLFQASAESLVSENSSRLSAMQRAEKNIADLLEDLTRTSHRMRQEAIDEELFDVISGFDALSLR